MKPTMEIEGQFYLNEVAKIEIERLPVRGLVRVRFVDTAGETGLRMACWGHFNLEGPKPHDTPEIVEVEPSDDDVMAPAIPPAKPAKEPSNASDEPVHTDD